MCAGEVDSPFCPTVTDTAAVSAVIEERRGSGASCPMCVGPWKGEGEGLACEPALGELREEVRCKLNERVKFEENFEGGGGDG